MAGIFFSCDKLTKYTFKVGLISENIKKPLGYYSTVFNPTFGLKLISDTFWLFPKMTYINPIPVGPIYTNELDVQGLISIYLMDLKLS
jgi:hypothetical protein